MLAHVKLGCFLYLHLWFWFWFCDLIGLILQQQLDNSKKKHDRNLQSLQDILQKAVQKATQSLYIEASVGSKNSQEKNTTPVGSISLSIWSNHADSPLCIWPFFTYTRCELPHQHVPKLFTQFCTEFYKIPPTPNISNIQTPKFNGPNSFRSSDGRSSFNGGSGGWKWSSGVATEGTSCVTAQLHIGPGRFWGPPKKCPIWFGFVHPNPNKTLDLVVYVQLRITPP